MMKRMTQNKLVKTNQETAVEEKAIILKKLMPTLRKNYSIRELGIFGSYVSGNHKSTSDIDLLVEFQTPPSFFGFIRLENFLSQKLGVKADLVMKDTLKPAISRRVLSELVQI
jgi:hypothetical protein